MLIQSQHMMLNQVKFPCNLFSNSLEASIFQKFFIHLRICYVMIGWPLMIYKIPLPWVESVVAYLNGYLRKWLVLVKTCQMYLFTVMKHHVHCQCMVQNCKVGGLLQPQQSENQSVRDNIPDLYTDGKWKVAIEGNNKNVKGYG